MDYFSKNLMNQNSDCEKTFHNQGPFWHLSTSGRDQDLIFMSDEDYEFGLTSSALALIEVNGFNKAKVRLIAYAIRENHIHEILAGEESHCLEYFKCRKRRLRRYFALSGRKIDLSGFNCKLMPLSSLQSLRNEILYVNNTNYEEDCLCDFYSRYEAKQELCYTSGRYYFDDNNSLKDNLKSINSMSFVQKRDITKSDSYIYPDWYKVYENHLYPPSFCDFSLGEKFFESKGQYLSLAYPVETNNENSYGINRLSSIRSFFERLSTPSPFRV